MKEFLSKNDIKHTYIEITDSMANLKAFLKYRDNRKEFDSIKKYGSVGIPAIVVNEGEKIFFEIPNIDELK
ncbi:hypothetical protein [Alkaliphilus serpentinus]|uniref:hypothetical protein n=1 Tax=Alkaliphilus serpentinus TaxID=1482731 RepID=UPI001A9B8B6B|nr:hypothetical protein [Alkaliphilus serpentinus]